MKQAELEKEAYIRKTPNKKEWCVYSEKGKNMGCYPSRKQAKERLRQIEYFKHKGTAIRQLRRVKRSKLINSLQSKLLP